MVQLSRHYEEYLTISHFSSISLLINTNSNLSVILIHASTPSNHEAKRVSTVFLLFSTAQWLKLPAGTDHDHEHSLQIILSCLF